MARSDEAALTGLLLEYAEAVRHSDAQRCSGTWAEEGRWVLGPGRAATGRDDIVRLWSSLRGEYEMVVQMYLAASFDIDGDTAAGRAQMFEFDLVSGGARALNAGHYDDTFKRTAQGWRFTSRQWTNHFRWEL